MCFSSKAPSAPPVQPQPKPTEDTSANKQARKKANTQTGVFGNIFTSALGDSGYDTSTGQTTPTKQK